jgi:tetratricopeptide (TPR) repeat protein
MSRFTKQVVGVVALLFFSACAMQAYSQDIKEAIKLSKSEQFRKASSMFKALIKQTPANGDLYYFYGRNILDKYYSDTMNVSFSESSDSARAIYQQGLTQDPANPLNLVGMGGLDLISKKIPEGQAEFAKAMALLPSRANKTIKMEPPVQSRVLIEMAEAYVTAGIHDTASAFTLLRSAEKLDKTNPNLYIVKGDVYFYLLNDGSKAISNYNMAQGLDPKSPEAKLRVGQLWLRARQYTNALNYYQEVVKMDSTFAPAYRELGSLLSRAGRQEEAKKNFYKFLELSRNTAARKQFVNTLIDLKDYPEAIIQLNEIRKVDSTDNDVNRALAYSYYETQPPQYDKGLVYIKAFIAAAKPEKVRSLDYAYYGRLLSKTKQDSLAAEKLLKAYDLDTSKAELISEAAVSYTRIKKYDKAREQYDRKINMKRGVAMDYYNLGKVCYSLQDYVNADTNLAIFNAMQPEYVPGFAWRARTKSNLDQKDPKGFNMTGFAVPVYEGLIVKTQGDTVKYMKERFESFDYLAFYHYSQYMRDQKLKDEAEKALFYYLRMSAVNPNDEKTAIVKPVIDALKLKVK